MDGNNYQNNHKAKTRKVNINVSKETEKVPTANYFCSVPILQKVLEPSPGYQSRLYSVQVMRISDAETYYQNISGNSNHEDQQVPAQNERERSPTRDSKSHNEYRNSLDFKEFAQYKA